MTQVAIQQQDSRRLFWIASLMFFLSGGTGLAYQVIWFKRFAHVWGSSSLAFASVGGSFLFGLGVGAYLLGRYSDRIARPLRWYGYCELAIGLAAIIIPFEIQFLVEQSASFYSRLPGDPLLRFLLQFCVTLMVVGPPCVLMGGTLPLLIRELTARDGRLDQATGWLYAINTFGAAAGCFLTGFLLLPAKGLVMTNYLAAAINLSIGAVAVWMTRFGDVSVGETNTTETVEPVLPTAPAPAAVSSAPAISFSLLGLYVAVTLAGLGALILEMTWSRQLALLLGGSTYTYSATLFVVLVGIGAGSLLFHLFLRRFALNPWLPVLVIGALGGSCLLAKLFLPQLAELLKVDVRQAELSGVGSWRQSLFGNAMICVMASVCLELIPSIAMGILFPLFVDLTRASANRVGRTVGDVYAWNTFGSIAGASLTSILLFPWIGTIGSIALATGLYLVALILVLPFGNLQQRLLSGGCLTVGAALVAAILIPQNPADTNMAKYLYGSEPLRDTFKTLYFAEGASCNVFVATGNNGAGTNLRVNGKVDASDGMDMISQAAMSYVPRFFNPDARDVFVIGFGSGTTPGVSLLFPNARVTCCEIEPAVYRAASFFNHVNHRPQDQTREALIERNAGLPEGERLTDEQIDEEARFQIIFGDGRTTLQGSDQKYDLIISEPSNPWLAGVSNLFTQEFFQAAKAHLKDGGILAQWVQTYNLTKREYFLVVRTLRSEFPHCVICTAGPADTLLLASERPIVPNPAALDRLQKLVDDSPAIREDLQRVFHITDLRTYLLRHFTADERSLDAKAGVNENLPLNTDSNLLLEFLAPLHLFDKVTEGEGASGIVAQEDPQAHQALAQALGIPVESAAYQRALAVRSLSALQPFDAMQHFCDALKFDPKDSDTLILLERALFDLGSPRLAADTYRKLSEANPHDEMYVLRLAEALGLTRQAAEQQKVLTDFIEREPKSTAAREALGRHYATQNNHEAALATYQDLNAQQPGRPLTLGLIAQALQALRRPADAAEHYKLALAAVPETDKQFPTWLWQNNLAWIYATSTDPAARNGAEAVRLAKQACESVDYKQPEQLVLINTLACAYAQNDEFRLAVQSETEFANRLQAAGANVEAIRAAQARIQLFESGRPYREP